MRPHNSHLLFLVAALLVATPALAQSASFIVAQNGKPVGTASYSFLATPEGLNSTSLVRVSMKGLDYSVSKTERLTPDHQLHRVQLSALVNSSAVSVSASHDAAQFQLKISANGRTTSTPLAFHAAAVFLPDFDPGALETLLALDAAHNGRDLWAILPKQAGSEAPVTVATYADEKGTLNGKPIAVHHLVATISGLQTTLFSGPQNQLLQAELPQPGFALVRKGFVLTPPAKPSVPIDAQTP